MGNGCICFNNICDKEIKVDIYQEENKHPVQMTNLYSIAKYFNDAISHLNPQFSKYEANDAKDLIIYLLQQMHEELNYYIGEKLENIPKCNQLNELEAFNFFFQINAKLNFSIMCLKTGIL